MARTDSNNTATLKARLGDVPVLREKGDNCIANFRVVHSSGRYKEDGTWEVTNEFWVQCAAFGNRENRRLVDRVMRLKKGQMIHLVGRLNGEDAWTDDKGVVHDPSLSIIVADVFLDADDLQSFELMPRKGAGDASS